MVAALNAGLAAGAAPAAEAGAFDRALGLAAGATPAAARGCGAWVGVSLAPLAALPAGALAASPATAVGCALAALLAGTATPAAAVALRICGAPPLSVADSVVLPPGPPTSRRAATTRISTVVTPAR